MKVERGVSLYGVQRCWGCEGATCCWSLVIGIGHDPVVPEKDLERLSDRLIHDCLIDSLESMIQSLNDFIRGCSPRPSAGPTTGRF
jgi:hypothetical protein